MRATHITLTCWVTLDQLIVKILTYLSVEPGHRTAHSTAPPRVMLMSEYVTRPGQDVTAVLVSQVNVSQQSEVRTRTLPDTETGDEVMTQ